MKKIFLLQLILAITSFNLFSQSDSIRISECLQIERSDAKNWIERFQKDIDKYIDENRQMEDFSCDALFLGSSSIHLWKTLHEDMAPMKVIRRSYGGSTIRDILYNYDVVARGYDPKCIVLYVENDLGFGKTGITEYETFDLLRVFVQRIQRDYPDIPLYIISFKPSFAKQDQLEQQKVINHLLKSYADNTTDVEFIDITQAMYDENGNLREDIFLKDRLHLNAIGYQIWTSIIKPVISKH
ncbi:GDSL-type esterase/lipase family protein [Bacteroidales bacterium OttesenSCG-928-A17]|nr:GDSL-type esterase/lipase family protein [Bacteroidales bacterium OttesenSCG-928-A17]